MQNGRIKHLGAVAMEVGEEREEELSMVRVSLVPPIYSQIWSLG
jgi:hypothetical protein